MEEFLQGPLALLPLAPLAVREEGRLAWVVERMRGRIGSEARRPFAAKLWAATYVLMGLCYDEAVIDRDLYGVSEMEESVTYQALVRRGLQQGLRQGVEQGLQQGVEQGVRQGLQQGVQQGRELEIRTMILRQGRKKFGPPRPAWKPSCNPSRASTGSKRSATG